MWLYGHLYCPKYRVKLYLRLSYMLIMTMLSCCYCYKRGFEWYWSRDCKGTRIARCSCYYGSQKYCCWAWNQRSNHQRSSKCKSWRYGVGSQFCDISQEICVEIQFLGPSPECSCVSGMLIYILIIDLYGIDYLVSFCMHFSMMIFCFIMYAFHLHAYLFPDIFGPWLGFSVHTNCTKS